MLDHLDGQPVLQAFAADSRFSGKYVDVRVHDSTGPRASTDGLHTTITALNRLDETLLTSLGFDLRKFSRPSSKKRNLYNHLLYFGPGNRIPAHCDRFIFSDEEYALEEEARARSAVHRVS